jgi:predicted permease
MTEIRQALRSLRQSRWYAAAIIAVMALCVSLSTTVFAIVDGVLFKPVPYARSAELYMMTGGYLKRAQRGGISVAPRNIRDWTAAVPGARVTMLSTGLPASQFGEARGWSPIPARIDASFFDVLGVSPLVGGFSTADFADARSTAVIISYGVWQAQFAGRPDVVGQPLPPAGSLSGQFYVAGVLPREFLFPWIGEAPDLLLPLSVDAARQDDLRYRQFTGIVRLPPDQPFGVAEARMDAAAAAEAVDWVPRASDGTPVFDHAQLERLDYRMTKIQKPTFALAMGAALVLMLLGCINASGLMASRILDRRRDIGVRRALGGRTTDIVRLLVAENGLVMTAGAVLGVAVASPLLRLTLRLLPTSMNLLKTPSIDLRVVGFACALVLAAVVATSIWPAWRAARLPVGPSAGSAARVTSSRSVGSFITIVAQVAIGLALALGGVLLVGTLMQVWRIDPGFAADRVIVLGGRVTGASPADRSAALDEFERATLGAPGAAAVGSTQASFGLGMSMNAFREGATVAVRPGFFEAMGMSLVEGRWLTHDELDRGAPVAVMSRRAALKAFGEQSPIGRQLQGFVNLKPQSFEVVGLVNDVQMTTWDSDRVGEVFAPYALVSDQTSISVIVRSDRPEETLAALLSRTRTQQAGEVRMTRAAVGSDILNESIRPRRMNSWLFGGFAAAALLIVGAGILGLMAMSTAKRTREVGVRMALGSTPGRVVRLLVGEQLWAVLAGLAAGGLLASWGLRFVRSYLFHIAGNDPRVWVTAITAMLLVALAGALVPAVNASRVDPSRALRAD